MLDFLFAGCCLFSFVNAYYTLVYTIFAVIDF